MTPRATTEEGPNLGMKMSDVRAGMTLRSMFDRFSPRTVRVTELTERGFKYDVIAGALHSHPRMGMQECATGHEHYGLDGYSLFEQVTGEGASPAPVEKGQELCSDCPPDEYPTDTTRCLKCPRRKGPSDVDLAASMNAMVAEHIFGVPMPTHNPLEGKFFDPTGLWFWVCDRYPDKWHWEAMDYCGNSRDCSDLEQKMCELGWTWNVQLATEYCVASLYRDGVGPGSDRVEGPDRACTAKVIAALRAIGAAWPVASREAGQFFDSTGQKWVKA